MYLPRVKCIAASRISLTDVDTLREGMLPYDHQIDQFSVVLTIGETVKVPVLPEEAIEEAICA